jgi:hypothetical protein
MKMNAKEAKFAAQKRATELKNERDAAERKRQAKASEKWRNERANWLRDHISWIEESIAEAVRKGEDKASIWLASSNEPKKAEEGDFLARFAFKPELYKVIAHFKDLDYQVKFGVKREEHIDLSDLNPRDNWFTYRTELKISW